MPFSTIFFDLDDTLYTNDNGLWDAIRNRMSTYMIDRMGIPEDQVTLLRHTYYVRYGTTLRGLQIHHNVDADDYLAYVHDLPLHKYIQPDPGLQKLLQGLPQPKYIFTNADASHAIRVLNILGVREYFNGIVDVRAMNFYCKPEPQAYRYALSLAGESNARACLLIDDSLRNLAGAKSAGFTTVLVGNHSPHDQVDYVLESVIDLPRLLPELQRGSPASKAHK